jgi:septal ring factor EnvC (AmiA/AmiB activator)
MHKENSTKRDIMKKNQTEILELKNSISQIKDMSESFKNRLHQAEERISELEGRSFTYAE